MTDEQELIQKSQKGDHVAFTQLIKPYETKLYNFLAKMCNNPEAAKDMLQETLLNVFKKIGSYRAEAKFSTWLFQIATNNCLMLKRQEAKYPIDSIDKDAEMPYEIVDWNNNPEKSYDQKELEAIIANALQQLEPIYRSVFILSEIDNFSGPEIADILKISLSNVKIRLHRAKDKLRKILGPALFKKCRDCFSE